MATHGSLYLCTRYFLSTCFRFVEVRVNAPSEASGEDEDEEDEDDDMSSDCGYPNPGFCYCTRPV